jgi:hypothetical protein
MPITDANGNSVAAPIVADPVPNAPVDTGSVRDAVVDGPVVEQNDPRVAANSPLRYKIQLQGSGTPAEYDVKSVDMGTNGELIVQHSDVDAIDIFAPGEWRSVKLVRG